MNKRGNFFVILLIFLFIIGLLAGAVVLAIGGAVMDTTVDAIVPEISDLGTAGSANLTEIATYTVAPANTLLQSYTWVTGIIYILGLVGIFAVAFIYRSTAEGWLIPFFISLVILLVLSCIVVSQVYAVFYDSNDDIGTRLQEQQLISYLILYSPAVMSIFSLLAGLIMFSGGGNDFT